MRSERFRRLSREALWIVSSQVAVVVGSFVGVRLMTTLLEPSAYGELALALTIPALVGQTLVGPLSNGVARFYAPAVEKGQLGSYLGGVRRLMMWETGLIALAILGTVVCLHAAGRSGWTGLAAAAFLFALVSGSNSVLSSVQMAARQRSIVALHQAVEPWARFLLAAALVTFVGGASTTAMVGYALGVVPVLASQFVFFRRIVPRPRSSRSDEERWQWEIFRYSWPFAAWGLFTWLQLASDRWALEAFSNAEEVGRFAVLYQLGYYPISLATGMATQFLAPIFFQRAGDGTDVDRTTNVHRLSWQMSGLALGTTAVAVCLALLFHAQVFRLLVAPRYRSVSHLLPWMMLAGGAFAAGQAMSLSLMSQMKTRALIAPKVITALLGVLLNVGGAYWLGTTGLVAAAGIAAAVYLAWMAALSRRPGLVPLRSP
jgi:O-antigen/teichoic acid export membrane protein